MTLLTASDRRGLSRCARPSTLLPYVRPPPSGLLPDAAVYSSSAAGCTERYVHCERRQGAKRDFGRSHAWGEKRQSYLRDIHALEIFDFSPLGGISEYNADALSFDPDPFCTAIIEASSDDERLSNSSSVSAAIYAYLGGPLSWLPGRSRDDVLTAYHSPVHACP